ncbi:hypothetical protein [Synechocystis sp. LKSZ1]|uniref:hypothetical protein n=1 Tax=Synechocystis sp. LKSZ1 TaxID=3144951 RepID=UPI00336BB6B2
MLHFFWSNYILSDNSFNIYEQSNAEIAKWAEYYLSQKISFHQSSWSSGRVTESPDDILLGHLTWDGRSQRQRDKQGTIRRNWIKDNSLNICEKCHPNTYILTPWVPSFPSIWVDNMPHYQSQLLAAKKIFALCGKIWIEKTFAKNDDSIEFIVKDKLIHLNMGVAYQNFPIKKQKFNQKGERQLLHISNLADYKGFDITGLSLIGVDTLLHVATSSIQAPIGLLNLEINNQDFTFNFIGNIDNNDDEFNQWAVENCDFYIHTGKMDAQATTILENCSRGLIPLVTPESGFACPHAIYLTHNPEKNRKIIEWALELPEEELMQRSYLIREYIQREHNWETIFNSIWNNIIVSCAHSVTH